MTADKFVLEATTEAPDDKNQTDSGANEMTAPYADTTLTSLTDEEQAKDEWHLDPAPYATVRDSERREEAWIPVMHEAPRYSPFVLECSEGRFELSSNRARLMSPDEVLSHWHTLVVDFFTAPGPGNVLVESASPKYAHVLAKRTLLRNGELTQDMELHPLVRKAIAPGQVMLTYQLMPSQHLNRLKTQFTGSARGFLLHDTVTLLFGLLYCQPKDTTTTLTLHLPKSLVLLCGRNGGLLWSRRYTLSEDHGDDFQISVDAVMADMKQAARDGGFEIQRNIWIEGWSRRPLLPPAAAESFEFMPVTALQCGETTWYSALPGMVGQATGKTSLTALPDRLAARLQPLEKWIWATSLALALMTGAAGWWGHGLADRMEARLQGLVLEKAELESVQTELGAANTLSDEDRETIERGVSMAQTLKNARSATPLADLWNLISQMRPQSCTIQSIEINYEGKTAMIGLEGTVDAGLNQARSLYSEFLSRLNQSGFQIVRQELQLDMDTNYFTLTLKHTAAQ
jgi:hypothetical protein